MRVTLASSPSSGTTEQIPAIERVAEETTPCPSGCPTPEPSATPTCTADRTTTTCSANDDEPPDWAKVLLGLLGVAGVGGAGAVARNRSKTDDKKATTTKSWGDIARDEYAKPDEPISARASELSKIGAPVAAAMAAVLAGVGGWVTDAPKGDTIIAIAIILAVAVGGLLYVFATDFKARATVANARFESLAKLVRIEAAATSTVQADADAAKAEAAAATKARDEANVKAADASARQSEAEKRAASYAEPPTPSLPAWVPLAEVSAMVDDEKAVLYGVASAGAEVTHYLAEIPSEGFVWVPKGKVTFPR